MTEPEATEGSSHDFSNVNPLLPPVMASVRPYFRSSIQSEAPNDTPDIYDITAVEEQHNSPSFSFPCMQSTSLPLTSSHAAFDPQTRLQASYDSFFQSIHPSTSQPSLRERTLSYSDFWESNLPFLNTSSFNRARNTPVVPSMDVSLASPFSALPYTPFNNNTLSRSPSQTADLSSTQGPSLLNFSQSSDDFTMDLSMPSQSSPSQKWKEITTDVLPTFAAPPSPSKQPTKWWNSIPTLTTSD